MVETMIATMMRSLGLGGPATEAGGDAEAAGTESAAGEDALIEMPIEEVVAIPMPQPSPKPRSTRRVAKRIGTIDPPAKPAQPTDIPSAEPAAEEKPRPARRHRWM